MASKSYKENLVKPCLRGKWLRMPAGKLRKPQNDISQTTIVPGKLADESQLGGLSSLLQFQMKEPIVEVKPPLPKPLKKRYRDEVYDSIEPIVEHPPTLVVPENKLEESGENSKSPADTSEEDEERLKVWRTHILEENVNTKSNRARACKGQRYREFMWTNYSIRRRSNRWELNQDKDEMLLTKRAKTANKTDRNQNKTSKTSKTVKSIAEKSNDLISGSQSDQSEYRSDDALPPSATKKKQKKRGPKGKRDSRKANPAKDKNDNLMAGYVGEEFSDARADMKNNYSGFVLLAPNDGPTINNNNHHAVENNKEALSQDENRKLENGLVGSRKRKARRQGIRRLAPGSTFKGVDVIAENDLRKEN